MGTGPLARLSRVPPAAWIGLVLIAAALVRFVFPQADPPLRMGGSGGIFSDEGTYTTNARNLLLFGRAFTDEWNSYQYSPVLHILQLPVFFLLGVGLLQERLIPMALGTATVGMLYLFAARAWGREAGLYAAFFLATSYFTVVHSRLGFVETPQAFFMVLAVLLWQRARDDRRGFAAAAGVVVALVVITKSLGLWFAAAFFAAAAFEALLAAPGARKAPLRRLAAALAGVGRDDGAVVPAVLPAEPRGPAALRGGLQAPEHPDLPGAVHPEPEEPPRPQLLPARVGRPRRVAPRRGGPAGASRPAARSRARRGLEHGPLAGCRRGRARRLELHPDTVLRAPRAGDRRSRGLGARRVPAGLAGARRLRRRRLPRWRQPGCC